MDQKNAIVHCHWYGSLSFCLNPGEQWRIINKYLWGLALSESKDLPLISSNSWCVLTRFDVIHSGQSLPRAESKLCPAQISFTANHVQSDMGHHKNCVFLIKAEQRIHFWAHKICSQTFWDRFAVLAKPWLHFSGKYICSFWSNSKPAPNKNCASCGSGSYCTVRFLSLVLWHQINFLASKI